MREHTENLTIRCSAADLEIIDRLRSARSRGALLRTLIQQADREAPTCSA
ncbi:MAG: hypothetical protein ABFC38_11840 [Methanospirillum sp.]